MISNKGMGLALVVAVSMMVACGGKAITIGQDEPNPCANSTSGIGPRTRCAAPPEPVATAELPSELPPSTPSTPITTQGDPSRSSAWESFQFAKARGQAACAGRSATSPVTVRIIASS